MQTRGFRRLACTRLVGRGVLSHNLSRDGRRANSMLDGLVLEVGTSGRIRRRYRLLAGESGRPGNADRPP